MKHFLLASLLLLVAADANAQEGGRVSYFRTIIVQGPGTVPGDLTCIFCSVVVARGGVGGNVVTIGGDIDISGSVGGDAKAVGGMVRVRTGARAGGELFAMGGPVEREPGAHTPEGAEPESYPWIHVPGQRYIGLRGALAVLGLYSTIVSLVTLVLRPRRVQAIEEAITDHPFLVGLIGLVLCIVFGILLDTTDRLGRWEDAANLSVLGVAGILFAVGTAGVAQAIGELTLPRSNLTSLTTGISALAVLQLIPVLGAVVALFVLVSALGAAVWSGLGFRGGAPPKPRATEMNLFP